LYIDGKRVLHGWESFLGWYWFTTEKTNEQMSNRGDYKLVKDTIYFGLVHGLESNGVTSPSRRQRASGLKRRKARRRNCRTLEGEIFNPLIFY
jgi:hypothetical protein